MPGDWGINLYVVALGVIYLILTISVLEYFVLYRIRHVDESLEEAKSSDYNHVKEVLDLQKNDEIGRISSTINDVMERFVDKTNQLKQTKDMYASVVNDAPLLVCRFLPNGTITFVNESYAEAYGKTKEEMIGANLFKIIEESGGKSDAVKRSVRSLRPSKKSNTSFNDLPNRYTATVR